MRILVAIPVHNEVRYLAGVLREVRKYAAHVLVVDDGSTDGTAALLREFEDVEVLTHRKNQGYGQSLIDAFQFAAERGYDWVITMDCDEQHEPLQITRFVEELRGTDADIISGTRYHPDAADDDAPPADRFQINQTINLLLRQLLGLNLTDSFCGFKAHRVSAMRKLDLTEPGYAFPCQFWVQVVRAGLQVQELPVRRIYRDATRQFGGKLDDPGARLQHYLEVLVEELRRGGADAGEGGALRLQVACDCRELAG